MTPERRDWWCAQVLNEEGPIDRRRIVEAIAREARREALEAAAAECERYGASMDNDYNRRAGDIARLGIETADECAVAIRALIDKEPRNA